MTARRRPINMLATPLVLCALIATSAPSGAAGSFYSVDQSPSVTSAVLTVQDPEVRSRYVKVSHRATFTLEDAVGGEGVLLRVQERHKGAWVTVSSKRKRLQHNGTVTHESSSYLNTEKGRTRLRVRVLVDATGEQAISPPTRVTVGVPTISFATPRSTYAGKIGEARPRVQGTITPVGRWPVQLQLRDGTKWKTLTAKSTGPRGRFNLNLPTARGKHVLRIRVPAGSDTKPRPSRRFKVRSLHPRPRMKLSSQSAVVNSSVRLTGKVPTAGKRRPVTASIVLPSGLRAVAQGRSTKAGRVSLNVPLKWSGRHRVVLRVKSGSGLPAGVSPSRRLNVTLPYRPAGSAAAHSLLSRGEARWNPCRVIRYRVNTTGQHRDLLPTTKQVLADISRVSGLRFKFAGRTNFVPFVSGGAQPADLVIGYARPAGSRTLGNNIGIGGFTSRSLDKKDRPSSRVKFQIVKGSVLLSSAAKHSKYRHGNLLRFTLMHEISHALGVGHTGGRAQVMNPYSRFHRFGAGDVTALQKVGLSSGCHGS